MYKKEYERKKLINPGGALVNLRLKLSRLSNHFEGEDDGGDDGDDDGDDDDDVAFMFMTMMFIKKKLMNPSADGRKRKFRATCNTVSLAVQDFFSPPI